MSTQPKRQRGGGVLRSRLIHLPQRPLILRPVNKFLMIRSVWHFIEIIQDGSVRL
jgi:hypothetical protein